MNTEQHDKYVYDEAKRFLLANTPDEITTEIIDSYLSVPPPTHHKIPLNDIYFRL